MKKHAAFCILTLLNVSLIGCKAPLKTEDKNVTQANVLELDKSGVGRPINLYSLSPGFKRVISEGKTGNLGDERRRFEFKVKSNVNVAVTVVMLKPEQEPIFSLFYLSGRNGSFVSQKFEQNEPTFSAVTESMLLKPADYGIVLGNAMFGKVNYVLLIDECLAENCKEVVSKSINTYLETHSQKESQQ